MKPKLNDKDKEKLREYTAGYLAYLTSFTPKRQQVIISYIDSLYLMLLDKQKQKGP